MFPARFDQEKPVLSLNALLIFAAVYAVAIATPDPGIVALVAEPASPWR